MSNTGIIYSLDVVKDLSDAELYQRLFDSWGITNGKIEVWGELVDPQTHKFINLHKVRLIAGNQTIDYPLKLRHGIESGVYVPYDYAKALLNTKLRVWVKCELVLSPLKERQKHNNPFELTVKFGSAEVLQALPITFDKSQLIEGDETSYIVKSIHDFHMANLQQELAVAEQKLQQDLNQIASKKDELIASIEAEQQQATNQIIDEHDSKRQLAELELVKVNKVLAKNQIALSALEQKKSALKHNTQKLSSQLRQRHSELNSLKAQYKEIQLEMAKKIEKLKSYIAEKAVFLKDFEFIDEDDFDSFISDAAKERDTAEMVSFNEVFKRDYKLTVSYIHAFLKKQGILYPRHIIENYLTLIRSNDLIILAGDSGSGKTNLVQSFAKAVGGVSKIIPVKPNWTSSEDLLGYYNPLEKKYLATPFLEALIEAQQNPETPYFICLDEMNLARVEYYFADFLSKLEDREKTPEIQLYSDDESAHVLSELKAVVSIISEAKEKYSQDGLVDFVKLMQDEDVNTEMKRAFGFSDKDSLIKYHGDIRRMLSGVINTPSTIKVPPNVRIIGAINIDETTHYLSPKILDRAHIMRFESPLLSDWDSIFDEVKGYGFDDVSKPVLLDVEALGIRESYPKFERSNEFCELFIDLNKEFFHKIGVEFGMRTIRQGLNYLELFKDVNPDSELAINNFLLHKVLPKFNFEGNKSIGDQTKLELIERVLTERLKLQLPNHENNSHVFCAVKALETVVRDAKANDGVVNFWS
ncbi:AAA family ATPase [Shewanella sp. 5_MG-2023]|uniref:McrB family protein n=1 Tax=Shewanella sp. 5_MG-2023 TaxID=3062656 RepID=UPI0026E11DC5|nr:AAA family ATPase [Shewanella sp. 5_MG-2023]MDO6639748.1 AAA family ATPase [Shewanella sp. 5_MG-2023]